MYGIRWLKSNNHFWYSTHPPTHPHPLKNKPTHNSSISGKYYWLHMCGGWGERGGVASPSIEHKERKKTWPYSTLLLLWHSSYITHTIYILPPPLLLPHTHIYCIHICSRTQRRERERKEKISQIAQLLPRHSSYITHTTLPTHPTHTQSHT